MKPILTEVVLTCPTCGDTALAFVDLSAVEIQYCRYRKSCKNYLQMMTQDSDYYEVIHHPEVAAQKVEEKAFADRLFAKARKEVNGQGEDGRLSFRLQERIGQTYQPLSDEDFQDTV